MVNIFRKISTKCYQNRPGFVDDVTKNIWCVLGSQFQLLFTYKTHVSQGSEYTRSDIIQVSWKTF